MGSLQAFRDAFSNAFGAATFYEEQTSGLTAGQYSQYFNGPPQGGRKSCLGIMLRFKGTITASGAATPTGGTDQLDLFVSLVQVTPAPGAGARCEAITRQFAEFVWAGGTNTSISVAAAPTFASAGSGVVTPSIFIPIGGIGAVRVQLPGAITNVYSSNATIAFNAIDSHIISSDWTGTFAFKEELSASLGTGSLVSVASYTPATVAPDCVFMKGETSTTITQVTITTVKRGVWVNSTNTDVLQTGAQQFAPIAGATYQTTAGFMIVGCQESFLTFQVNFASGTTHYIGYIQVTGGEDVAPGNTPGATPAPSSAGQQGVVTPSGQVAASSAASGDGPASIAAPMSGAAGYGALRAKTHARMKGQ